MTSAQRRKLAAVKPTAAVLYFRVSTKKQAEFGIGLDAQREACRQHAARLGLAVVSEHQDRGISGKKDMQSRPGLKDAIAAVHATPGAVLIVYSLSRLARSMRLLYTLLMPGNGQPDLPVVSVTEPFDVTSTMGRAMLGMLGVFAQLESDLASDRTIDALATVPRENLGAPSMIEVVIDGERQTDPHKVAAVRRIQELYAAGGLTHATLADLANRLGVPTPRAGKRWHATSVRRALLCELPSEDNAGRRALAMLKELDA